uniref:CCR4-NOT transcription complex subunit 1 CAF1-binding domain-containing protein n=1 Tax=Lotharella oceanica TaxID=641309 RepID=A0A7S2XHC7_9EUKA|mmetsp:Transcript_6163/g.12324  ORF Transcript_6163/g.12324 Transcript_6163/m.12324 type:complete len:139 (+) Transcript_6163:56-472(+)
MFFIRVLLGLREAGSRFLVASLLTTLGRWIGCITLSIDRPIWLRLLDVKGALIHASSRGLSSLSTVVPFVVEVMKGCVESKVFRLPNPWVAAVLRCLHTICQSKDADEELRFCVEVLFKTLRVDPRKDLGPRPNDKIR